MAKHLHQPPVKITLIDATEETIRQVKKDNESLVTGWLARHDIHSSDGTFAHVVSPISPWRGKAEKTEVTTCWKPRLTP